MTAPRDDTLEIRVTGGSMRPLLAPGCFLTIERVDPATIRIGEIVMVLSGESVMIHRLVRREGDSLILRGDAVDREDAPVPVERVIGRATRARYGSWSIDLSSRSAIALGRTIARTPAFGRRMSRWRRLVTTIGLSLLATRTGRAIRRQRLAAVEIRVAAPGDLGLYEELRIELGSPTWLPKAAPTSILVIAIAKGRLVGCTSLVGSLSSGTWVRPSWRRLGIGRALLEFAVRDCRSPVEARLPHRYEAARALFARAGFRPRDGDLWVRDPQRQA